MLSNPGKLKSLTLGISEADSDVSLIFSFSIDSNVLSNGAEVKDANPGFWLLYTEIIVAASKPRFRMKWHKALGNTNTSPTHINF